jgi:hypothetical protein
MDPYCAMSEGLHSGQLFGLGFYVYIRPSVPPPPFYHWIVLFGLRGGAFPDSPIDRGPSPNTSYSIKASLKTGTAQKILLRNEDKKGHPRKRVVDRR